MSDNKGPEQRFEELLTLWIDNDEGLYRWVMDMAGEYEGNPLGFGERLKDWTEESFGLGDMEAGPMMDFLGLGISYIDWRKMGARYLEVKAETGD